LKAGRPRDSEEIPGSSEPGFVASAYTSTFRLVPLRTTTATTRRRESEFM
jgi:hypothetical protein